MCGVKQLYFDEPPAKPCTSLSFQDIVLREVYGNSSKGINILRVIIVFNLRELRVDTLGSLFFEIAKCLGMYAEGY